jgi:hypothetical protein
MILLKAKDKVNNVSKTFVLSASKLISIHIDLGTVKDDGIEKQIYLASHCFLA